MAASCARPSGGSSILPRQQVVREREGHGSGFAERLQGGAPSSTPARRGRSKQPPAPYTIFKNEKDFQKWRPVSAERRVARAPRPLSLAPRRRHGTHEGRPLPQKPRAQPPRCARRGASRSSLLLRIVFLMMEDGMSSFTLCPPLNRARSCRYIFAARHLRAGGGLLL